MTPSVVRPTGDAAPLVLQEVPDVPKLCHSVFFTLRDRTDAAKAALVEGCRKHLTGHPGTLAFAVGTCAGYDRQVNDRDHDVALHIVFDSHESHDAYQHAPRHADFIAEHATGWAKVRVFDADLATFES